MDVAYGILYTYFHCLCTVTVQCSAVLAGHLCMNIMLPPTAEDKGKRLGQNTN